MSQLSGAFTVELPTDRLSRELAAAVVAQLDRADFIGALADAVIRRMAGDPPAGAETYDRGDGDPDPGAGGRRGARFGGVVSDDGAIDYEDGEQT